MRVVFAYDGSPFAKRALRYAGHLGPGLEATVITVSPVLIEGPRVEGSTDPERDAVEGRRQLEDARRLLADLGVEAESVHTFGNPAAEILGAAEERGADLIVVGQRGRSAIARFIDGSVTERIVRHAACDVLVAR
jgi:nucleotide-binding universal stress UspA family protein